jgi:hypothetical protein
MTIDYTRITKDPVIDEWFYVAYLTNGKQLMTKTRYDHISLSRFTEMANEYIIINSYNPY